MPVPPWAGSCCWLGSPALAFGVNALTFGLSALAVLSIPVGPAFRPARSGERPAGVLRGVADGAAALCAHPDALRLIGADIMCSVMYGAQTVLLLLVSRSLGMGTHGYGYLFAGIGAGALIGTALAGRVLRVRRTRLLVVAALAAVGLPMPLLAVVSWPALAIGLVAVTGAGAILVEILTDTSLQRMLDEDVFGRAYGLALPASVGGIAAGALAAPLLVNLLRGPGALVASGAAVLAYALLLLHRAPARRAPVTPGAEPAGSGVQAADAVLAAQP